MKDDKDFDGLEKKVSFADQYTLRGRFMRPVDTSAILKHLMWQEFSLSRIIAGWIIAIPTYDQKLQLGRHAYLHNRNVKFLRERIVELPGGLNDNEWIPSYVREAFDRLFTASSPNAFFISYLFVLKRLHEQYDELLLKLDPVLNAPTVDQIKLNLVERDTELNWVVNQTFFTDAESEELALQAQNWEKYAVRVWSVFAGFNNHDMSSEIPWPIHPVQEAAGPMPEEARLEDKFQRFEVKRGQTAYTDPEMSVLSDSVKQMIYIYATEFTAGESLACVYYSVEQMPLAFYFDLARHMWDEFRHSRMGMRRLEQLGYTIDQFKWPTGPGLQLAKNHFTEIYSSLTMIGEACGFKKKRKSAEAFWKFGDVLSAITVEFDLSDERSHVDFGTKWGPELYKREGIIVTHQEMAEQARLRRLNEFDAVSPEDKEKLAKNFPAFCSLHTSELNYHKY
ncbi:DUF455 family protein [Paenibacillus sp. NPDC056579]|uniref:DUF455 family protein n=1 Tax=Paenibacillus sp. NPDC056579 TaxID=3345871 RepID=UPI0036C49216